MPALNSLAALSLSLILGLAPFAVIAVDDFVVARGRSFHHGCVNPDHALGTEGR